ncbi:MAG: LacI family DNA-binding transcriptional regulator [Ilumatobacteraceae bacterium]
MARPTLDDIAKRVGVSRGLVSLALRELPGVRDSTRIAIKAVAAEVGYIPDAAARNLASRATGAIGVMIGPMRNPFFADVVAGLTAPFEESGYHIFMVSGRHDPTPERSLLQLFRSYRMDGAVLVGPQLDSHAIERFGTELPTVMVGRNMRSDRIDVIVGDDRRGAALAVEHLYNLGHRDIAHLSGGIGPGAPERRRSYIETMKRLGLDRHIRVVGGGYTVPDTVAGIAELLTTRPPTAIFAVSDVVAIAAIQELARAGLSVPDDVSIVGYDNSSLISQLRLGLSSIDQPREQMGQLAAELLLERFAGRTVAVKHLLTPTVVARTSSAIVGPARSR